MFSIKFLLFTEVRGDAELGDQVVELLLVKIHRREIRRRVAARFRRLAMSDQRAQIVHEVFGYICDRRLLVCVCAVLPDALEFSVQNHRADVE